MVQEIRNDRRNYPVLHTVVANPAGTRPDDVPSLFRRAAGEIERLGAVTVMDVVLHTEFLETGEEWCSLTIYYFPTPDEA